MNAVRSQLKYANFLRELVKRDFKKKYYKSVLGVLWTILNPLLMMMIITLVFSALFQRSIEHFPAYYLCGWLIFNFNGEATTTALHAIVDNGHLIKKIYVPSYLFSVSKAILALINKLISLVPLALVMVLVQAPFHWTALLLPLLWLPLFLFSLGLGLALAAMGVYFRDLFHLYGIITTAWMYLTPIFYPMDIIPERLRILWAFNPLYHYVTIMRGLVLYGTLPEPVSVLYAYSFAALAMGLGVTVYAKLEKNFLLHF